MKNTKPESPLSDTVLATLLQEVAPVKLAASRKAAMKKALLATIQTETAPPRTPLVTTLRAQDGKWKPMAPKVDMQILLDDGFTTSWLVRVAPGGRIPSHEHIAGPEEFLVMSGTCEVDGASLRAGDFQVAMQGSRHIDIHSAEGCMLFIKSPSFKAQRAQAGSHAYA